MSETVKNEGPWDQFVDELTGAAPAKVTAKVMVVDDSSVVRNELRHYLAVRQCEIVEAVDGEDALAKMKIASDVSLMFLDVNMPNMDGLTFVEKLAADVAAGLANMIPIVMLTTESTKDKVLRAKQAGVLGWIIKPAKKDHVLQIFDRFAKGRVA